MIQLIKQNRKLLIAILLLLALFIFSQYGFLSIMAPDNGEGISYRVQKQGSDNSEVKKSKTKTITMFVSRGSYEISTSSNDSNSFNVVKVAGFFKKTKVATKPLPEKERTYVGDNPASCMFYMDKLYSYECGGYFNSINKHMPAHDLQPTYVEKNSQPSVDGLVEAVVKTRAGTVALVHLVEAEGNGGHMAYLLGNGLAVEKVTPLAKLDAELNYSIKAYREGFIVYSSQFYPVWYFASLDSSPTNLNITGVEDTSLKPLRLNVVGDRIVTTYSNRAAGEVNDVKSQPAKSDSQIFISSSGKSVSFLLPNSSVSDATICGADNLCVVDGSNLKIYKMDGNKVKYQYRIGGVEAVESINNQTYVVRRDGIIDLSIGARSGYLTYTFGDYSYCGLVNEGNHILLCALDKNKRLALSLNLGVNNTDSIDKKIQQLEKLPTVESVSVSNRSVYISPDLGELVYNPATQGYDYSDQKLKSANTDINKAVQQLGLAKLNYKVINTVP